MADARLSLGAVERGSSVLALAATLAVPFAARLASGSGRRSRAWSTVTTVAVAAGAVRSVAIDARRHTPIRATAAAAATAMCATAVEAVGSRTGVPFGRYRYTDVLRPAISGVPVQVALAWTAMLPPADAVADAVVGWCRPGARLAGGALAMTAWDVVLDPQMTRAGVWQWERRGRYRGIPATNYVGWMVASMGLLAVRRSMLGRPGAASPIRSDGPREPTDRAHVATYATVGVLSTVAFATFWRDRLVAVAGAVTMLPLAAVAVLRTSTP